MAVYQISRIQVRRGQANQGTGIPQLASGEMAWAVDTQELYIGNGAVSEGAPGVGNTRLLTLNDLSAQGNLLELSQYSYAVTLDIPIITGASASSPVYRTLQTRLDDQVSTSYFGTVGNGVADDTAALQRAINQQYLNANNYAYGTSADAVKFRTIITIPPGIYKTTSTIFIPSYTTLVGAGELKTIINFVPAVGNTSPAFRFVNDTSTASAPSSIVTTTSTNQPRWIDISDLSIHIFNQTNTGMQMDCVRNSRFSNIRIASSESELTVYNPNNIGIKMNALSDIYTCQENHFENITLSNLTTAVSAKQDIVNNMFTGCHIQFARQGFLFGIERSGVSDAYVFSLGGGNIGEQHGPRQTTIVNTKFYKIRQHAIYLYRGEFNSVSQCRLYDVGNNNTGDTTFPEFPQMFFRTSNNSTEEIQSSRTNSLNSMSTFLTVPYLPEVSGNVTYASHGVKQFNISQTNGTDARSFFRLPISVSHNGLPGGSISYIIDYTYKSLVTTAGTKFTRSGRMLITADVDQKYSQLSDDYNFAGPVNSINDTALAFSCVLLDIAGAVYTGAAFQVPYAIGIYYTNTLANDTGNFTFSYTADPHFQII
jgi:hypothetical protein